MMMCALRRSSVKRAFCRRSFWTSSSIGSRLASAHVSVGSEPRGFPGPALAASRSAETSTDLRGGEGRPGHLASSQQLRLLLGCVVCTQLCRSAASVWQLLRDLVAKPALDRRPLWLPLYSAAARLEASLRSVSRQPNPQGKEQHQENSRSSLISSFSPFCSLIKSTKTASEMLARRDFRSLVSFVHSPTSEARQASDVKI